MPSHLLRKIAWGLTWRWAVLFASLITPAPPVAIGVTSAVLVIGMIASVWRRGDLLGSAWRVLLAVVVINLGFWLGGGMLVPAMTLAVVITIGDLWWCVLGPADDSRGAVDGIESFPPVTAIEPYRPMAEPQRTFHADPILLAAPVAAPRRRASRGSMAAGFRMLVAACVLVTLLTVGAFSIASRASGAFSAGVASVGKQLSPITAALPGPSTAATPAPTPTPPATPADSSAPLAPNGSAGEQPAQAAPAVDPSGPCVSLPDSRYEIRLPTGQVIVVSTRHRDGCPDLAALLKALQDASRASND